MMTGSVEFSSKNAYLRCPGGVASIRVLVVFLWMVLIFLSLLRAPHIFFGKILSYSTMLEPQSKIPPQNPVKSRQEKMMAIFFLFPTLYKHGRSLKFFSSSSEHKSTSSCIVRIFSNVSSFSNCTFLASASIISTET